jgi:hypothetical protein
LSRHAKNFTEALLKESNECPVKAIHLAREVVRRLSTGDDYGKETAVNAAIVRSLKNFYKQLRAKHKGRHPEMNRQAWSVVNSVLGGTVGVPLASVAEAVDVPVENLYSGKKRWTNWLGIDSDTSGDGAACLQDIRIFVHGNSWPEEWVQFTQEMWKDDRVTRPGEGSKDHVYDPSKRGKDRGEPHLVCWLEQNLSAVQAVMQTEGEKRFGPDYVHVDGRSRPNGFPKKPKKGRELHGGGIGKKMNLLRPYFVKNKGGDLCLCWRHLEWDFLCSALWR